MERDLFSESLPRPSEVSRLLQTFEMIHHRTPHHGHDTVNTIDVEGFDVVDHDDQIGGLPTPVSKSLLCGSRYEFRG